MDNSGAASKVFHNLQNNTGSESYERRRSSTTQQPSQSSQVTPDSRKPCRSCTDFKTWIASQRKVSGDSAANTSAATTLEELPPSHTCPLDINELGRNTWGLLHTMAANYPDRPSSEQRTTMKQFFESFSKTYPCEMCAHDFQKRMKKRPVRLESQHEVSQWLCETHNGINKMLGKSIFDCSKVNERWRDGWTDGSCG